jgi:hypothetical protein
MRGKVHFLWASSHVFTNTFVLEYLFLRQLICENSMLDINRFLQLTTGSIKLPTCFVSMQNLKKQSKYGHFNRSHHSDRSYRIWIRPDYFMLGIWIRPSGTVRYVVMSALMLQQFTELYDMKQQREPARNCRTMSQNQISWITHTWL